MPLLIIAILVLPVVFAIIITNNYNKVILEKSQRVKTLLNLNAATQFRTIRPSYSFHHACNSKRQLDNLSLNEYLISLIDSNESFYRNIVEAISYNRETYNAYLSKIENIKSSATEEYCRTFGFNLSKFVRLEKQVFKKNILRKPQWNVVVFVKATYTSPQGRNHYMKEARYEFDELTGFFERTMKLKANRQTRQYQIKVERSKMTDSLRYDILKRDNFRCQLCGSSAQDGVKLHVDHIIPVSKGGKTVPSNLRTLCDRCNLGKSDKIE